MTTSIDSNVIVALWRKDDPSNENAARLLGHAAARGGLVVSGPVFAELMADPQRSEEELTVFFEQTGIFIDWEFDDQVWLQAGRAFRGYVERRRLDISAFPGRILTDFLIGGQAVVRGYSLLTFDRRLYAAAFPALKVTAS